MIVPALVAALVAASPVPAPQARCATDDARLAELSGLAADDAGLWGLSDGGRRVEIHRIDPDDCAVLSTRTARIDPRDPEDLAVGPDGALWVGDIGDNHRERATVAVVVVPTRGPAQLHRLTYPDGPHDAEALLVDATGSPVIIIKDPLRTAGIYRTDGPPAGAGPTPLIRVGELALPESDTVGGPVGGLGSRLVTGAAVSVDRKVVAVRTYTDAWLYPAPGGDVLAALARPATDPVRVPLPGEPQGEAIAFLPDGTLVSGSESRDGQVGRLRAVSGAASSAGGGPAGSGLDVPPGVGAPQGWWSGPVTGAVAAGVLLIGTLAVARRRRGRIGWPRP